MSLSRRLDEIEKRLKPADEDRQGTIEIHYTQAWPPTDEANGANLKQCTKHGASCAVSSGRTFDSLQRVYIFRGPWLGIG